MELWIRSQDKALLKIVDQLEVCEDTDGTWFINDGDILGKYKTEKRALEVLDEIQNILNCKCLLKSYDNITPEFSNNLVIQPCEVHIEQLNNYVYEMPQE